MRYIWSIFIIVAAICANAQTVQNGVVMEYNKKVQKTPLAGVELNVRSAGSTVSGRNGNFSLKFLTLKAGDRVVVRDNGRDIRKEGYEIFNKDALEQWNLNPNAPFSIVMCRSDRFKAICDNYYSKASVNYKKQYDKEISAVNKLKNEGKLKDEEYRKKLTEIQENYDRQLDNLDNYVDRFARIDLSELQSEEQGIIELVEQGLFDEAIARYDELQLEQKITTSIKNRDVKLEAAKTLTESAESDQQDINRMYESLYRNVDALKLAGGTENLHKAKLKLISVADIDTTNIDLQIRTASFLSDYIADYDKALQYFNQALEIQLNTFGSKHPDVATSYKSIGNVYQVLGAYPEALEYYEKALEIRLKVLGPEHPQTANSYYNIGNAYYSKKEYAKSLDYLNKALGIFVNMYGEESETVIELKELIESAIQLSQAQVEV